ncbi:hypothetical protein Pint_00127 [Pistacia integerrima]|uniref:Uncharacterized protein n=1 Tax=Pistacia integerrima TaxID=434235 RepID=A0ACC0ZRE7_9ROSI|nr:hypothetical protein Pint_00127 [Pistacia integerrima]
MFLSPTDRNTNSTVEVQTPNNKSMETASKVEGGTSKINLKDDVVDGEKSAMKPTASNSGAKVEMKNELLSEAENQSIVTDKEEARKESVASADKQKRRFSISLSREEIEADILATGGSKRLRRSKKKRAKYVQRILDNLFPGLRLKSIMIEDYRVSDSP